MLREQQDRVGCTNLSANSVCGCTRPPRTMKPSGNFLFRLSVFTAVLTILLHCGLLNAQLAPSTVGGLTGTYRVVAATGFYAANAGHENRYQFNADGTGVVGSGEVFLWTSYTKSGNTGSLIVQGAHTNRLTVVFISAAGGTWAMVTDGGTQSGTFGVDTSIPPTNYTITVNASPSAGGKVSGAGTFTAGSTQTVKAEANNGYTFTNWTANGSEVSSFSTYNFTLSSNLTLFANFIAIPITSTITVSASPSAGGSVIGSGTYPVGSQHQISANSADGWTFTGWTDGSTQNPRMITVPADGATYTANFSRLPPSSPTNQVLSLDGTSGYVTVPSASDLQNPDQLTIEAWLRPLAQGGNVQTFISKSDGAYVNSSRSYEIVWVQNGGNTGPGSRVEANLFVGSSNWTLLGAPAAPGQWVHVAVTYESQSGRSSLYTNGVLAASRTTDADGKTPVAGLQIRQTALPVYFGKLGQPNTLNLADGQMDEIRFWNKARTQAEIALNMACRLTGTETNLIAYYDFDDGSAMDLAGHGHNGTPTGGAAIVPLSGGDIIHQGGCGSPFTFDLTQLRYSRLDGLRFRLIGPSATTVNLQSSSDLLNWTSVTQFPDISLGIDFVDPTATNSVNRFYRAVFAP
jgi:uncharacterized repeat protein (TIGR02543 family)